MQRAGSVPGWDARRRTSRLSGIANNTRFLILPWVRVAGLGEPRFRDGSVHARRVSLRPALDEERVDRAAQRRPEDRRPHLPGQIQRDVDDERRDDASAAWRTAICVIASVVGRTLGAKNPVVMMCSA